jgi:hypothetical protein
MTRKPQKRTMAKKEAIEQYIKTCKRVTYQDLADIFGVSNQAIQQFMKYHGIKKENAFSGHRISKTDLIDFIKKEGNPTFRQIGEHFGETTRYAQFCVHSYGINKKEHES